MQDYGPQAWSIEQQLHLRAIVMDLLYQQFHQPLQQTDIEHDMHVSWIKQEMLELDNKVTK